MEVALPDVSQNFQKTKGFLTEQVEKAAKSASDATAQAKSSLSQTADKAKESITQTTNSAVHAVNQATNNALGTVAETTKKARHSLSEVANQAVARVSETTNSAVNTLNQTTSKAVDSVNIATEKAKASLQDSIHKAENISGAASDALQNAINANVKDWMDSHPVIFWLVSHPLRGLVMLMLFVFIILGFFQALGSFFAEGWLFILQSHGKFMQGVFSVGSKSLGNVGGVAVNSLVSRNRGDNNNSALQLRGGELNSLGSQERLANIVTRLEVIREEQNQLLQEASAILGKEFKGD